LPIQSPSDLAVAAGFEPAEGCPSRAFEFCGWWFRPVRWGLVAPEPRLDNPLQTCYSTSTPEPCCAPGRTHSRGSRCCGCAAHGPPGRRPGRPKSQSGCNGWPITPERCRSAVNASASVAPTPAEPSPSPSPTQPWRSSSTTATATSCAAPPPAPPLRSRPDRRGWSPKDLDHMSQINRRENVVHQVSLDKQPPRPDGRSAWHDRPAGSAEVDAGRYRNGHDCGVPAEVAFPCTSLSGRRTVEAPRTLCTEATVSVAPGSLFRGRRS
jgi:hypothetical protein